MIFGLGCAVQMMMCCLGATVYTHMVIYVNTWHQWAYGTVPIYGTHGQPMVVKALQTREQGFAHRPTVCSTTGRQRI